MGELDRPAFNHRQFGEWAAAARGWTVALLHDLRTRPALIAWGILNPLSLGLVLMEADLRWGILPATSGPDPLGAAKLFLRVAWVGPLVSLLSLPILAFWTRLCRRKGWGEGRLLIPYGFMTATLFSPFVFWSLACFFATPGAWRVFASHSPLETGIGIGALLLLGSILSRFGTRPFPFFSGRAWVKGALSYLLLSFAVGVVIFVCALGEHQPRATANHRGRAVAGEGEAGLQLPADSNRAPGQAGGGK